jgi:hypothetical protein
MNIKQIKERLTVLRELRLQEASKARRARLAREELRLIKALKKRVN